MNYLKDTGVKYEMIWLDNKDKFSQIQQNDPWWVVRETGIADIQE